MTHVESVASVSGQSHSLKAWWHSPYPKLWKNPANGKVAIELENAFDRCATIARKAYPSAGSQL